MTQIKKEETRKIVNIQLSDLAVFKESPFKVKIGDLDGTIYNLSEWNCSFER